MYFQGSDEEKQKYLALQKRLRIMSYICISVSAVLLIAALIVFSMGVQPLGLPLEEFMLPLVIVGAILFLYGVFYPQLRGIWLFAARQQTPALEYFERCSNFIALSVFGLISTVMGLPIYYSLLFFAFAALGFFLTFPTSERVTKIYNEQKGKGTQSPLER